VEQITGCQALVGFAHFCPLSWRPCGEPAVGS